MTDAFSPLPIDEALPALIAALQTQRMAVLQAPPGALPVTLCLRAGDGVWAALTLAPGARQTVFLDIPAGAGEALVVEIDSATSQARPARRRGEAKRLVGIGVTAVMLCRRDDLAARIDFLEREHFTAAEAVPGN